MAVNNRKKFRRLAAALMTSVSVCVSGVSATTAFAQSPLSTIGKDDNAKMLLRANELVYDQDQQIVTANGGVQMYYNRYRMVAQRVQYNQKTGHVIASGNIEFVEPGGNRVYAEQMDVTNDFGQGFVNTIRLETTDNTRMAAESAERQSQDVMVLNNTVYTACLPCSATPGKAPLWQVKAQRVIRDGQTHTIRLEHARFELFGAPIGYLPFVEVPDETVERKSGFLFPKFSASDNLGFSAGIPYYHVFSPSMDATITPTYYSSQGLLVQGEVRNQFDNGSHTLEFAGIHQQNPKNFDPGTSDRDADTRAMVSSHGEFDINPRWKFGWNGMLQTDNNFARTYKLENASSETYTNEIYLRGLGQRNYFDLHGYYFDIQDDSKSSIRERQQAIVYPSFDYDYVAPEPVFGGQLSVTSNLTNLTRRQSDAYFEGSDWRFPGLSGDYSRFTTEAEWKRTFTTPQGLLLTPIVAARGDGLYHSFDGNPSGYDGSLNSSGTDGRYMLTAGLEARYPFLIEAPGGSHIIEPIGQIFVRPDEQDAGGLPNEDAQSFVYDATTLFDRDKFSGFDRIEGGTRANLGFRYTGSLNNGIGLRGIFGQSYQLAGKNSFASDDLVSAGNESGLETTRSDYVAMAAVDLPQGFTVQGNTRFDEKTFDLKRTDASVGYTTPRVSGKLIYTKVSAQPQYGDSSPTEVLKNTLSFRVNENWSLAGTATWDFNNNDVIRRGIAVSYADECTIFTLAYTDKPASTDAADWTVSARLSFRTLGDVNVGSTKDYTDYTESFRE